jgi:O-antigen/teichoic acid export membrane protein
VILRTLLRRSTLISFNNRERRGFIRIFFTEKAKSSKNGVQYRSGTLFLTLSAIAYLYSAFGSPSSVNLINGQGHTVFSMKLTLLQATSRFPMSFILVSQFGVLGLIATTLRLNPKSYLFVGSTRTAK